MNLYIYPTDSSWYNTLRSIEGLDEVNFWRPSGQPFKALRPGDLFLFRLRAPINKIGGGGFFVHAATFPLSMAWDAFGIKNGTATFDAFAGSIARYRKESTPEAIHKDVSIGCIVLLRPFFLNEEDWIPLPSDYSPALQQGKRYSGDVDPGLSLADHVLTLLSADSHQGIATPDFTKMYGEPSFVRHRLGQGSFRTIVSDLYQRRCAVSEERTFPILQAAHIRPVSAGGTHSTDNGLLLRSDIHILFDKGYVTIDEEHRFLVSTKLNEEWSNGKLYYGMDKKPILLPRDMLDRPSRLHLEWHRDMVFKG
jgi:putative restriction endonuclease